MLHQPHTMRFAFLLFGCTGLNLNPTYSCLAGKVELPFWFQLATCDLFSLLSPWRRNTATLMKTNSLLSEMWVFKIRGLKFAHLVQSMENEV